MARRKRFHSPLTTYHVMLRGNDGQPIFFSDSDKSRMCLLMQEGTERFGHNIHAFCFMPNHIHLAIQVAEVNISRVVQHLAFRYTRYINRLHKRIGHLFQGRFKSIVVDESQYLKELIRYIHLNPVRAGLVRWPEEYLWSSHRAYIKLDEFTWLTQERLLQCFNYQNHNAIDNYQRFILKGIDTNVELNFKSGSQDGVLGDKDFIKRIVQKQCPTPSTKIELGHIIAKVCEQYNVQEAELSLPGKNPLQSKARAVLSFLVRECDHLSLESLAKFLKREASGLSKLASRLEKKCFSSDTFAKELSELQTWLLNFE